jgi:hypothetical protein
MMDTKLSMRLRKVTSPPNFRKIYLEDDVTVDPMGKNAFRIGSDSFENEPVYFVEGAMGEIVGVRGGVTSSKRSFRDRSETSVPPPWPEVLSANAARPGTRRPRVDACGMDQSVVDPIV